MSKKDRKIDVLISVIVFVCLVAFASSINGFLKGAIISAVAIIFFLSKVRQYLGWSDGKGKE